MNRYSSCCDLHFRQIVFRLVAPGYNSNVCPSLEITLFKYKIAARFYAMRIPKDRRLKKVKLLLFNKSLTPRGARRSLGRTELGSVALHRHTSRHWRAVDWFNYIQENTFISLKYIFRPPERRLQIVLPIWPFGPGKRFLSPSNVR